MANIITKAATTDEPLSGSFTDLYDVFKDKVEKYHKALEKATSDWEGAATDPKLTLAMQAAQGDLGNLTRGLGSLISALVALQSEATQKIK
ncbi:hypothetical protein [Pantoea cypripedii]|uniref:Uncharacterized protein n=1 Tax=Pantoea cypripedii TaxID=55209 RepID=A0A6B9G5W4_PANCY|nr:hypothetical protein [Pantoea cypripedii]QGY32202.1 hypothetical protein CUN67_24730 [Pantoea cypripedii]